jgi:hypothetical protein
VTKGYKLAKFKGAILACKECGKQFRVPPNRKDAAKYCSKECADLHRHDSSRKEKIGLTCKFCGQLFFSYPSNAKRRKFCSYECSFKDKSLMVPLDRHFYNRSFWYGLRKEALLRYGYTCQSCGVIHKSVHVHHIVSRFLGGKDEGSNLTVLCNSCHKKAHWL